MSTLVERIPKDQILEKAAKAERRAVHYAGVVQRCEQRGLVEEALEAERMRLEHAATADYWRSRAGS